jgi:chemotaxis protein MotB
MPKQEKEFGEERPPRREEAEVEERTDGWMTTYSDMVTLLFAFFVLMFAISNVDSGRFALMAAAFQRGGITEEQFGSIMDMYGADSIIDMYNPGATIIDLFPEFGQELPADIRPEPVDRPDFDQQELDNLYTALLGYIDEQGLGDSLVAVHNGEFLMLMLASDVWFPSGSADITPHMVDKAALLAGLIYQLHDADNPFEIVVVGHTDNVPINTPRFPSNWELSVARAVNFLRILISESHLDPSYFSARGCGEERPIADNDTPEGRQLNRRVEILISMLRQR